LSPVIGAMVSVGGIMQESQAAHPEASSIMRKAFAINYLTHDGVMQSPGAFQ
jgi:hypothetical protein